MADFDGVRFRVCEADDIDGVLALQREWAGESITHGYRPDSPDALMARLGPYFLVAEEGGAVIGFISGSVRTSEGLAVVPAGERYLEVDDLYVRKQDRGRQVGGRLVELLLESARAGGMSSGVVYSATTDVRRILSFYERHGFRSWFVQMYRPL